METIRWIFGLGFIGSARLRAFVSLLLMAAFVTLMSVWFFGAQSLRLDEAQSLWQTSRAPFDILKLVAGDVHVPLYHLSLHYWRLLFGDTVAIARTISLVFLILILPAIYFLGKLAYSRSVGLFSALLVAVSPFMNWYGNEIRMYTLFTFLVILNQYFFIRIFKDKSNGAWWGYAITALLGIYSHYFFFLSLASQAVFYFMRRAEFPRGSFKKLVLIAVLVVLAISPWLYLVHSVGSAVNQQPMLSAPTSVNLFSTFAQFLFGFQDDHINTVFLSLWPIALIFGFITLRKGRRLTPVTEYLFMTIVLSVGLAFLISATFVPVFVSRYLSFTIPALYLLLSAHFASYPKKYGFMMQAALVILMLVTLGIEIWSGATPVKENYREATTYLNAHVQPQDVVVVSAPFTVYPVEYYYDGSASIETLPMWNRYAFGAIPAFSESTLPAQVQSIAASHQNVWLLLSYDQGYESKIKQYFDTHYRQVQMMHFSSDLNLYEYQVRYDTPLARTESAQTAQAK
ncbi:MAG: Membrane protein-like protein [Parcubacteria group bacterium]|nr:Membrane protein-like protein [Parcubacteria group bacterium]